MIDDVTDPTCDSYIIEISFMNDQDYMLFMLTFCDMNVQSYADYMRDWHQAMEPAFGQSRDDTELFDLDTSNG
jgi:hypothetical protein